MSIHNIKRKQGSVYRVMWRDESGKQRSRTFSLKRDAETWEAKIRLAKRQGELSALDSGRQLLRDFVSDWRALHGESHLAPKTLLLYDYLTKRQLLPQLGHVPLRQLTTERIQQASADLIAEGTPPASVRKALTLLQGMLERAVEWGRITNNPARYVRKPPNRPKRMTEPLSPRQVESLRRSLLKKKRLRDATLISVLAYAGLRPGEALALRWRDVRDRTVLIDKALSLGEERTTKTRRNRSVRLLAPLTTDLAKWRLASDRSADDDLIFPTTAGKAWTEVDYHNWKRRHFKTAAVANGLDGVRLYDLRHSFASLLLAEQTNPAEIAAQLGHSLQVLFSTYAHVIEDFRGVGQVSAEGEIRNARKSPSKRRVAQKLPGDAKQDDGQAERIAETSK